MQGIRNVAGELFLQVSPCRARDFSCTPWSKVARFLLKAVVWCRVSPDGEILFFAPPKKSIQKKGGPGGLPANAGSLRFSPIWALAELAGFAAPGGLQTQLRQDGSLNPKLAAMLGCARRASNPAAFVVEALFDRDQILIATRAIGLG